MLKNEYGQYLSRVAQDRSLGPKEG
jgi:hypothetical protein